MAGGWRAAATALMLAGVLAAPAQATVRKGTVTDAPGDARGGAAGTDVVAGAAQADDEAGTGAGGVGTAAAPTTYSMALVGTMSGGTCGAPFVLFAGAGANAVWVRDDGTTAQRASIERTGTTVVMAAQDATLKVAFDCAIVATSPNANAND